MLLAATAVGAGFRGLLAGRNLGGKLLVPFLDLGNDVIHFLRGELGIHREADASGGVGLSVGHAASDSGLLAPRVASLLVNGDRVMRLGVYAVLDQESHELVAPLGPLGLDDVEVKHMAVTLQLDRQIERLATLEAGSVASSPLAAGGVILGDVLELGAEDAGVQVVQAAVEAETVDVARGRAVVAQPADGGINVGVVGDQRAAVAEGAKVLLDDKAGRSRITELADLELRSVRANALSVVFDDLELVLLGDLIDGDHVRALPVEVDGYDGLGFRGDGRLNLLRADALGRGAAIDEDRCGPRDPDGFRGGEKGVRVGDDLVAGADAQGHQGHP